MSAVVVDQNDPTPPFEQIRAQIAALIGRGELAAGERLPTVRQLAGDLRVAPGTVARAYKELEAAGFVVTKRAAGTRVASDIVTPGNSMIDAHRLLGDAVRQAQTSGLDDERIRAAVEEALRSPRQ